MKPCLVILIQSITRNTFLVVKLRLKVLGRLEWALDMVNVKPESNPLHEGFWDDLIGPSQALLKEMRRAKSPDDDHDGDTPFWALVWNIARGTDRETLLGLTYRIERYVFPTLKHTRKQMNLVRAVQNEEGNPEDLDQQTENETERVDGPNQANGEKAEPGPGQVMGEAGHDSGGFWIQVRPPWGN